MDSPFHQGDIVWLSIDPVLGHEQAGRRPVLIVWNDDLLQRIPGLAAVCPITTTDNGFPMHVPVAVSDGTVHGFVQCEHTRTLDLAARGATYAGHMAEEPLQKILAILRGCFAS